MILDPVDIAIASKSLDSKERVVNTFCVMIGRLVALSFIIDDQMFHVGLY